MCFCLYSKIDHIKKGENKMKKVKGIFYHYLCICASFSSDSLWQQDE
jgi:hypothetical protein